MNKNELPGLNDLNYRCELNRNEQNPTNIPFPRRPEEAACMPLTAVIQGAGGRTGPSRRDQRPALVIRGPPAVLRSVHTVSLSTSCTHEHTLSHSALKPFVPRFQLRYEPQHSSSSSIRRISLDAGGHVVPAMKRPAASRSSCCFRIKIRNLIPALLNKLNFSLHFRAKYCPLSSVTVVYFLFR